MLLATSVCLVVFYLVVPRAVGASAAVDLQATVDKTEASLEDQILLQVSVSGIRGLDQRPTLPPLPDFLVEEGGTSTRTEIVNGRIHSSVDFTYTLTPRRPGRFTIGPVTLSIKGEHYQSTPIVVTIHPPEKAPADREGSAAYITHDADIADPYVNQQVTYTFRFFTRLQTVEAQLQAPSFDGFWVEDLGKERQYTRIINGVQYSVTEIKKALFPTRPGTLTIGESILTAKFLVPGKRSQRFTSPFDDPFFNSPLFGAQEAVTRVLRAEPLTVSVRPLPTEGKPSAYQGLVGTFDVEAVLGQSSVKVGDSTTLTITVRGRGNLRDLADVLTDDLPQVRIYPDNPTFEIRSIDDMVEGTKTFKKALVPLQEGLVEIPPIEVSYFDASSGTYKVARARPLSLSVTGSPDKEIAHSPATSAPEVHKIEVRSIGDDILPIHDAISAVSSNARASSDMAIGLGLLVTPPVVFFVTRGLKQRRDRLSTDRSYARRKEALRNARRALASAKRLLPDLGQQEFFRELSRCLKDFIGDKINLSTRAMTPMEIEERLKAAGIDPQVRASVRNVLEELEYCQYVAPQTTVKEREVQFRKTKHLLRKLEKSL